MKKKKPPDAVTNDARRIPVHFEYVTEPKKNKKPPPLSQRRISPAAPKGMRGLHRCPTCGIWILAPRRRGKPK